MTSVAAALYEFWHGFGLPVYVEDMVPDHAQLPYITYSISNPEWRSATSITARVWYRSESIIPLAEKCDEIRDAIGEGISIPVDGGCIWIFQDTNFMQIQPFEGDNTLKCAYLNMVLQTYI